MKNLIAVLLILFSIGIFYFVTLPTYDEIKTLSVVKDGYDKALNNSQEAQSLRDSLETKYNSISAANLSKLESFLPDSIDNIRLIIEIDKIAGRYNMTLSNARVALVKDVVPESVGEAITSGSSTYGTGKLDFAVTGTYEAYIAFIKDLEQSLRLIDVTSVSLSDANASNASKTTTGLPDIYNYKTTLNTYWLK